MFMEDLGTQIKWKWARWKDMAYSLVEGDDDGDDNGNYDDDNGDDGDEYDNDSNDHDDNYDDNIGNQESHG